MRVTTVLSPYLWQGSIQTPEGPNGMIGPIVRVALPDKYTP